MRLHSRDPYAAARALRFAEKLLVRVNRLEGKLKKISVNRAAGGLPL
jgi:hypothetical protein